MTTVQTPGTGTIPAVEPNVTAVLTEQIAEGAGTEEQQTEHEATSANSRESDGTGEGTGSAHEFKWLDPATLRVHPRNVRDDLGDLTGLADSITAQGVLEALTVVPHVDAEGVPGYQLVAGHRRAAAAVIARAVAVACIVRHDLAATAEDRAGQARHVGAMLSENLHRAGLSAVEEARGVQAMIDLGESVTKVAKGTGLGRKRVAKAAGVARLNEATAAAVTAADLTLDQAAAVAVYADDTDATAALIEAATAGPGQFAHALTRAKHAREQAQRAAALLAELTEAGRRVLETGDGAQLSRLSQLAHDGADLTAEAHAACEGSAVYLSNSWNGVHAVEVCTDPAGFGHANRCSGSTMLPTAAVTDSERALASDARRAVIAGNRDMAAANETRREWVRALLLRKTAPKGALRFAVETMTSDPRSVSRWLSGQSNAAQDGASADLHIKAPGLWSTVKGEPTLTSGEPLSDGRLPVALLGHVAGAIETGFHKGTWRNPSASDARWLRFLVACGYTLAEVEQRIVDAIDARTSDHDTESNPTTDEDSDEDLADD
ncbi:ParB N-terminal domain-containing protein [Modestobacter muralis]|uniref:ParB N-terminal domain-containing protein n=1 Tax=Modestobacter muralis TaxID=1608614 RepID=A0A6P0F047_9ACTN|nr:ParB N-terminal domain-containing protein [Modestobacter muralis]NEK96503.1 ParB N-terminal domain-containing protein [Modestobacter muralis]NEN53403.1 ParB N-terminal domain-containing protein [Modestobacter muralis]